MLPSVVKNELRQATLKGKDLPHLSELAEQFIVQAGGAAQIAHMLWEEYRQAPSGGVVRAKILDMIMRCWRFVIDTRAPVGDLGLLSEVDLEKALTKMVGDLSDGQETSEPAAARPDASATGQEVPPPNVPTPEEVASASVSDS